jgi:hypothetical protein
MGIRGTAPRVEILNDGSVKFSTLIEEDQSMSAFGGKAEQAAMSAFDPSGHALL